MTPSTQSVSHSVAPYSAGQYSSQPSSPTYVTRDAMHGTSPTVISRAVMYGCGRFNTSRTFGPHRQRHAYAEVTSFTYTEPSCGMLRSSHARSCVPNAVPVIMRNRSSARRSTERSASIPPRAFSSCVYTSVPTGRSMRFAHSRSRNASAPGPSTSSFENDD